MIATDQVCGRCGHAFHLKNFRGADVFVCSACGTVTLSKADFRELVRGQPVPLEPMSHDPVIIGGHSPSMDLGNVAMAYEGDGPELGLLDTEETEEYPDSSPGFGAPTELSYGEDDDVDLELDGAEFDAEVEAYRAGRRRGPWLLLLLLLAVVVGLGIAASVVVTFGLLPPVERTEITPPPTVPAPGGRPEKPDLRPMPEKAAPQPPADPVPEPPPPVPEAPTEPVPEPKPVSEPVPAPPPTPTPRPVAPEPDADPAPLTVEERIRTGWATIDESPLRATQHFRAALDQNPTHPDANYGYGYALLKQGRMREARGYLCRASNTVDATAQREIQGLLRQKNITCP